MKKTPEDRTGSQRQDSSKQKGRQPGADTNREGDKPGNEEFRRQPGQGMRGEDGGQRESGRGPSGESTGSDTRKHTRPPAER